MASTQDLQGWVMSTLPLLSSNCSCSMMSLHSGNFLQEGHALRDLWRGSDKKGCQGDKVLHNVAFTIFFIFKSLASLAGLGIANG